MRPNTPAIRTERSTQESICSSRICDATCISRTTSSFLEPGESRAGSGGRHASNQLLSEQTKPRAKTRVGSDQVLAAPSVLRSRGRFFMSRRSEERRVGDETEARVCKSDE